MKTRLSILLLAILQIAGLTLMAQVPVKVISQGMEGFVAEMRNPVPEINTVQLQQGTYSIISLPGFTASGNGGAPMLPYSPQCIEIPAQAHVEVNILNATFDTFSLEALGMRNPLLPMQPVQSKAEPFQWITDSAAYNSREWIGEELFKVVPIGVARSRNLASLEIHPVKVNLQEGLAVVCTECRFQVSFSNFSEEATLQLQSLNSSLFEDGIKTLNQLPQTPKTGEEKVVYMILTHPSLAGESLNSFVEWKRRQGFEVELYPVEQSTTGTSAAEIQQFILSRYQNSTAEHPVPTFLLLVGDENKIPTFPGVAFYPQHPSDLYYTLFSSGDFIPDCYIGRLPAQDPTSLEAQVNKLMTYEQYNFEDDSFLGKAMLVAGIDNGTPSPATIYCDPAMDYMQYFYTNPSNGYSDVTFYKNIPSMATYVPGVTVTSNVGVSSAMISKINQGLGLVWYSGHGTSSGWFNPGFYTNNVNTLSNYGKFGIMIGNCCLSNKFDEEDCFGEALMRKPNAGVASYIGASNNTHWSPDFYFEVGFRGYVTESLSPAYDANNRGAFDHLFHTHGEAFTTHRGTLGAMMMAGNMAIQLAAANNVDTALKHYYWEIYHIMGDPSLMPWLSTADSTPLLITSNPISGDNSFTINTVANAFVALTQDIAGSRMRIASTFADDLGNATLLIPDGLFAGEYELTINAQNHIPLMTPIFVEHGSGPYVEVSQLTHPESITAGTTIPMDITLTNSGNETAHNITVNLFANMPGIPGLTLTLDTLAVNQSATIPVSIPIPSNTEDQSQLRITIDNLWYNAPQASRHVELFTVNAPKPVFNMTTNPANLAPGTMATITLRIQNTGHSALNNATLHFEQPLPQISLSATDTVINIPVGGIIEKHYSVNFASSLPTDTELPFFATLTNGTGFVSSQTLTLSLGLRSFEDFESGNFTALSWQQGSNPWEISTEAHSGNYSAKSKSGLANNGTSSLTLSWNAPISDSITFYYKVSSESSDIFHFFIDGTLLVVESGTYNTQWLRASFPVTQGPHTFVFDYVKDWMMTGGSDCAWIDDIHLPSAPSVPHDIIYSFDTVCQGSNFIYGGESITTDVPGTYNYGTTLGNGDIEVLTLTVIPTSQSFLQMTSCDSFEWNGQTLFESGNYYQEFDSDNGCDSIIHLELHIFPSEETSISVDTIADSYSWMGHIYSESGEYVANLTTIHGCDSIITLVLNLMQDTTHNDGIITIGKKPIEFGPNPTHDYVIFSREVYEAAIIDIQGRTISIFHNTSRITLKDILPGVYTLRLVSEKGFPAQSAKIIKM